MIVKDFDTDVDCSNINEKPNNIARASIFILINLMFSRGNRKAIVPINRINRYNGLSFIKINIQIAKINKGNNKPHPLLLDITIIQPIRI